MLRHYFRRNGKRTVLRGPFGSAEFWVDYNACLGKAAAPAHPRPKVRDGSFAALAALYFSSPSYKTLADSSRVNYRRVIEGFLSEHGHGLVKQFRREHVDIIIGGMDERPGAGIVLLKRIRTLVRYAIALKWIDTDPTLGVASYSSTEFHTWTNSELAQFEAYWKSGTRQRLAYSLHLYTGQRGSDICPMSYADIAGDVISVVQEKTDQAESDEKLIIPMHPKLQREMARHRKTCVMILTRLIRERAPERLASVV